MSDEKAKQIISIYDTELGSAETVNFRTLYQNAADLLFPRESNIISLRTPGEERGNDVIDPTGITSAQEMASGLSINLFPPGQRFYNIIMSDRRLNDIESVKRTLGMITDLSHEKRANSNFMLQANNSLMAITVFGTCNTFSEWLPGTGLNYRDYDIGQYVIFENSKGRIDGNMIEFKFTAQQAVEEWGDAAGPTVVKANSEQQTQQDKFKFIWSVRARSNRKRSLIDNLNMPSESIIVNRADQVTVEEGGFEEFPFAIARWTQSSNEKWGRGLGTVAMPAVRELQSVKRGLTESANKWNDPPLEILEHFDGEVQTFPRALNFVQEKGTISAIDQGVRGNFPINREFLEMERDEVRKIMLNDIFIQLRDLKGDRRTTLEIRERLAEGLQRLGTPFGRLQEEWLTPLVTRDILLLLRNGQLPPLPPEMAGKSFRIEYIGRLALELKSQQSVGWLKWASEGAELEGVFPGITDNVNVDEGYKRRGETLGVNVSDMSSEDEVKEKRQVRAEEKARAEAAQLAAMAAQGYSQTTKAPEEGSLAEAVAG